MMADEYLDDRAKAYDLDQPIIGHELHWPPRQRRTVPAGLWLVHRKLYDLNSFVDHHPGGPQLIGLGRGSDATALVESYHALADRSKVDRVLSEFYVRDATEAETPLEAKERLEWSDCGFYRTLANRVAAVLTPAIRQQRRRNGLYACMSACVCLLWSTAVSGLADTDATSSYATRVMLPAVMAGLLLCCLLGAFHEAGHGALFDARCRVPMGFASMTANRLAAAGGTLLTGVSDEVFTESHAGDHHTHPNLPGADLDPEMWEPLLRKCSHAPWHPWHAYQHFFAPILYLASATALSLTHQRRLGASLSASLRRRMRRRGSATMARGTAVEAAGVADGGDDLWAVVGELMLIVAHWTLVALLPMGIALSHSGGAGMARAIAAIVAHKALLGGGYALLFLGAHETRACIAASQGALSGGAPLDWGVYQLGTTANVVGAVCSSRAFERLTWGILQQSEHHLFPGLSHVHFAAVRPVLELTCREFGVQLCTVRGGLCGAAIEHWKLLRTLSARGSAIKARRGSNGR